LLAGAALALPAAPRVVASFSILGDLVRLAGAEAQVLAGAGMDVHEFEPTPAHARMLAGADVLVSNGLGLEPWLGRLAKAAGFKGRTIVASAGVRTRMLGRAVDPHGWQDVSNAKLYVSNIREGLGVAGGAALDALDRDIRAGLAAIPRAQRVVVTTHDAFGYFGAAYGVDFLAPLGLSTEEEPTPKALAALIGQIRARHVRALFFERLGNPALIQQIARETGVRIGGEVYSDTLSPPDGPASTYEAMMRHNLAAFVAALA
jgi:zinc/manganese transport system substrate-binding protein